MSSTQDAEQAIAMLHENQMQLYQLYEAHTKAAAMIFETINNCLMSTSSDPSQHLDTVEYQRRSLSFIVQSTKPVFESLWAKTPNKQTPSSSSSSSSFSETSNMLAKKQVAFKTSKSKSSLTTEQELEFWKEKVAQLQQENVLQSSKIQELETSLDQSERAFESHRSTHHCLQKVSSGTSSRAREGDARSTSPTARKRHHSTAALHSVTPIVPQHLASQPHQPHQPHHQPHHSSLSPEGAKTHSDPLPVPTSSSSSVASLQVAGSPPGTRATVTEPKGGVKDEENKPSGQTTTGDAVIVLKLYDIVEKQIAHIDDLLLHEHARGLQLSAALKPLSDLTNLPFPSSSSSSSSSSSRPQKGSTSVESVQMGDPFSPSSNRPRRQSKRKAALSLLSNPRLRCATC